MIKEWIEEYNPKTQEEVFAALREVMQEVTLAGLQRAGFFERAAFYGGTALRIFYGLDRYSEDLDFSLLEVNPNFSLEVYFDAIILEFEALGMKVTISEKNKAHNSNIDSAFLKSSTAWKELTLDGIIPQSGIKIQPSIKIKIEVDRQPPLGFETEEKLLLRPFSFYVKCFTLPSLFAGKMHALLFRKWLKRVKGRDWYDLEWYIKKGVSLDLNHFLLRAKDSGDWVDDSISKEHITNLLIAKIENVNFDRIREDIVRFIPNDSGLEIWSSKYFLDLIEKLRFKEI
ncbi:nucleotidyl transferase AbiEii/AbiGii toxin family protein [Belliella sp. DSM 107340]|uniref:Nucleotidyl transferase AbiEii/AbiGii toxin family protein n=1 Tax=Belliella calami TaxID=2923436 RepID=A0ABS9UIU2_9BACT|nr:nucleotidyl transferase AbiEii/AbiGii toxin family protein [Belliella calami]MCH7396542.1 nucleotidyl transferase AbiEii/AbiGii toxin family protein [Belliella calami]